MKIYTLKEEKKKKKKKDKQIQKIISPNLKGTTIFPSSFISPSPPLTKNKLFKIKKESLPL